MPGLTQDQIAHCEAQLNNLLHQLQVLIPVAEFQPIDAPARAALQQRRDALAVVPADV